MAQLIKLYDCISRYEMNPYHYPTQFIRLKHDNWDKLQDMWEMEGSGIIYEEKQADEHPEEKGLKEKILNLIPFTRKKEVEVTDEIIMRNLPHSKQQLTQYYLNQLFPFQIKWATSTLSQVSYTDKNIKHDKVLRYFLQRFPDIYLIMYYPIFSIKRAPIDGEIIMISPFSIDIIHMLDVNPLTTIIPTDDRTWRLETDNSEQTMISPTISLRRTEQIVKSILNKHQIEFEITKTVLAEHGQFLYNTEPYKVNLIGAKEYEQWFQDKRNLSASLKNVQLKVMDSLLKHCLTTSVKRHEWDQDSEEPVSYSSDKWE